MGGYIENLIETTMLGYDRRTFDTSIPLDELPDDERAIVLSSREYVKEYNAKRNEIILKNAMEDFEKLRDIDGMPDDAIEILKQWTNRDGDDDEYWED